MKFLITILLNCCKLATTLIIIFNTFMVYSDLKKKKKLYLADQMIPINFFVPLLIPQPQRQQRRSSIYVYGSYNLLAIVPFCLSPSLWSEKKRNGFNTRTPKSTSSRKSKSKTKTSFLSQILKLQHLLTLTDLNKPKWRHSQRNLGHSYQA